MKVLGIESSCDETAASVIEFTHDAQFNLLSNTVYSQTDEHAVYGGVVPEIASRAHMERIESITQKALADANTSLDDLDLIAVTSGPGLLGGLIVGTTFAKSLAFSKNIKVIGINHLEGHALSAHLTEDVNFPYILLLVSGGHCQFIEVLPESADNNKIPKSLIYKELGSTLDDSIGECFDKVAKMLGLPYPGGPAIEKHAKLGDPYKYKFPQPLKDKSLSFSFSGLKSAVRREIENKELQEDEINDICASFQETIAQILTYKCQLVIKSSESKNFVLAGGVAANRLLRNRLESLCQKNNIEFYAPPVRLCTDNASMIAYVGAIHMLQDNLNTTLSLRPRWPLTKI